MKINQAYQFMTPELKARFKEVGQQDIPDPLIIAKYFNPCGSETWYASEYDEESDTCFGYLTGMWEDEWGRFSLEELRSVRSLSLRLPIERDLHFNETRFSMLRK